MASTPRLAILDTDSGFVRVLARRLESRGWAWQVFSAAAEPEALVAMRADTLVVDLRALGGAGWDYLSRLRAALPELAVVVCTGPSSVAERVRGLRLGADDWLAKPCHPEEVIARVEAIDRRRRRFAEAPPVVAGELEIRPDQFQAFVQGRSVDLTRREFELLELLAGAEGRVLERDDVYRRVWGYEMAHGDRSVDVFVRKLRSKLAIQSPGWRYIHTHFGVGYRFAAVPETVPEGLDAAGDALATAPALARDAVATAPALARDAVATAPAPARDA